MNPKVLITGYPGFLADCLVSYLDPQGYDIYTLGLLNAPRNNHILSDLSEEIHLIHDIDFDIVLHAAGKAHTVPKNKKEEDSFYKVNLNGTANLIKALDNLSTPSKSFIFISTVAVYGKEAGENIDETIELAADTAYGKSKKLAEDYILNWKTTAKKTIIRLPLLVGKNPPGNLAKMIKSIKNGTYFNVGKGEAKRSMVLADDIARFIPTLAQHEGVYNLTDGYHPTFAELQNKFCDVLNKKKNPNIPYSIAKIVARIGDKWDRIPLNSNILSKMTSNLTFSDEKSRKELGWSPRKVLDEIHNIFS